MTTLDCGNRLQRLHRLQTLTIPRQWGSLIVPERSKTLMRAHARPIARSRRASWPRSMAISISLGGRMRGRPPRLRRVSGSAITPPPAWPGPSSHLSVGSISCSSASTSGARSGPKLLRPDERFAAGVVPVVFSANMDLFDGGNETEQNTLCGAGRPQGYDCGRSSRGWARR